MAFTELFPVETSPVGKDWAHVVCFSGGEQSAIVAIEVKRRYSSEHLVLLNHNINSRVEAKDIKRFKKEVAAYCGVHITYANMVDWRSKDQFDVVIEENAFKTSSGLALCTSRMKTQPFNVWLDANLPDKKAIIYYGFAKFELKRVNRRAQIMGAQGWITDFPLVTWPSTLTTTTEIGIRPPQVYSVFKHANCTGCLKAGVQHWYVVFCTRPDIWAKAKHAEHIIGHSILSEGYLADLECKFVSMKAAGVPASERIPHGKFWSMAKAVVSLAIQSEEILPCECVW